MNGGIDTNSKFETSVNGLYSIGEATGGLNGASRMPGMGLLEGFIAGKQAGRTVCDYANNVSYPSINSDQLIRASTMFGRFSNLTNQTRKIADAAIFIERTKHDLLKYQKIVLSLMSSIKRKEIAQYIEYDIAEMVLTIIKASLLRKESRGFFFRKDYPNTDQHMEKSIIIEKKASDNQLNVFWE
ncbi:MAG: FAD-binding protein [Planctomycetota bacterium]